MSCGVMILCESHVVMVITSLNVTVPSLLCHGYQNIPDWWVRGTEDVELSSTVALGNQDLPSGSHDDISASQVFHDSSPPCPGRQGNSPAQPLYENILLSKVDH